MQYSCIGKREGDAPLHFDNTMRLDMPWPGWFTRLMLSREQLSRAPAVELSATRSIFQRKPPIARSDYGYRLHGAGWAGVGRGFLWQRHDRCLR